MADEKAKLIEAAISQIEKDYGKGSIMRLGNRGNVRRINRGSLRQVDLARFLMAHITDEFNAHSGAPL